MTSHRSRRPSAEAGRRDDVRTTVDRSELQQSWAKTRAHLARAGAWVDLAGDTARCYAEYLDANELQLAMDELEGIGSECGAVAAFWGCLADAAREMGLSEDAARYDQCAREADSPTDAADRLR